MEMKIKEKYLRMAEGIYNEEDWRKASKKKKKDMLAIVRLKAMNLQTTTEKMEEKGCLKGAIADYQMEILRQGMGDL